MNRLATHLTVRRLVGDALEAHVRAGRTTMLPTLAARDPHRASTLTYDLVLADLDALPPPA